MQDDIEIKKVDSQGRVLLPLDWREKELNDSDEVIIIKDKDHIKLYPKKKRDFEDFFGIIQVDEKLVQKLNGQEE